MALKSIIVTVQGVDYELELNETTGYYEKTLSPLNDETSFHQPGGYFPVSITATDTTDLVTTINSDDEPNLRLFVAERHKPKIEIISPSAGDYITGTSRPEIQFKVTDNEYSGYSGVDKDSIVLKADNVPISGVEFEVIDGGYLCKYTPKENLPDGSISISIDAADNDGNKAETVSATFRIDNKNPALQLTSPAPDFETSNSTILIEGTTDDENKPITVSVTLNGVSKGTATVESDGHFSKYINLDKQGDNHIAVTATDDSGKSTTIERIVKYNTTAPIFTEVQILFDGKQVDANYKVPSTGAYLIRCKVTTS